MKKFLLTSKTERIPLKFEYSNNDIFQLGGGKILDKDFDLRSYLENAQENMKIERKNRQITSNRFSNFSNHSYFKNRNKDLSPIIKNIGNYSITNSFSKNTTTDKINYPYLNTNYNSNNISTKYTNNDLTTNKFSINSNMNTFFNISKSLNKPKYKKLKSIYLTNQLNETGCKSNEYFNIYKAVKEIKSSLRGNYKKLENFKKFKPGVGFNRDYLDVVCDSKNLINNYYNKKRTELDRPDTIKNFMNQNEEIAVKNVVLKIMNKESEKLYNLTDQNSKKISKNQSTLENDEKDFENYSILQKTTCKNLENTLTKIRDENIKLLAEERINKNNSKTYQDEIVKALGQIEDVRVYAVFVNEVLGGDASKFEHVVLPDYNFKKKKFDQTVKDVIENYDFYLCNDNRLEEKLLKDPDDLYDRFNEIELAIIRLLEEKEETIKSIRNFREENKDTLDELKEKYNELLAENEEFKNNLENEIRKINFVNNRKRIINESKEFENLIEEIYLSIGNTFLKRFSNNIDKTKKNEKNDANYILEECQKILNEKEDSINYLLKQVNNYTQNDPKFYNKIIDKIKREEKEAKFIEFKKKRKQDIQPIKTEKMIKSERLMFVTGKYDPKIHKNIKKEKKPIEYKQNKKLENEELLNYE